MRSATFVTLALGTAFSLTTGIAHAQITVTVSAGQGSTTSQPAPRQSAPASSSDSGGSYGESEIRIPESHSHFEIEVHGVLGFAHSVGIGGGARVGIPIISAGPIPRINNSLAISVGADLIFWPTAYYYGGTLVCVAYDAAGVCTQYAGGNANSAAGTMIHADGQWNFYIHPRWSVFAEIGIAPEFLFCSNCQVFYFWPDVAVGGRLHFGRGRNSYPALTVRLGFPLTSVGVSF